MPNRSTKEYRKNEAEVMRRLGFKETKNSGAGWIEKEDGQSEHCICQLKSTDNRSISIKQDDLHILEYNAAVSHKLPVFAFQFLNTDEVWVAIKESDIEAFKRLIASICEESKDDHIDAILYLSKHYKELIDTEKNKEYNTYMPKKAGKTMNARQAFYDRMLKEREQEREAGKERMKERNRERREMQKQWQKKNLNRKG